MTARPCKCLEGKVAAAHSSRGPCECYSPHVCGCRQSEEECKRCGGSGYVCSECGDATTKAAPFCPGCAKGALEDALAALSDARTMLAGVLAATPSGSERHAWAASAWSALRSIEDKGDIAQTLDAPTTTNQAGSTT